MRNVQEQVKKSILLPNIVQTFHCLNKLLKWSQTLCKFSVLSLEFQFFSINGTIFTHNRSEQVWLQNTKNVKNMRYEQNYLDRRVVGSFITITSAMSPNLEKYSLRPSAKKSEKIGISFKPNNPNYLICTHAHCYIVFWKMSLALIIYIIM